MSNSRRTALYHLYDSADRLLYVGIAYEPRARWKRHATEKSWWSEVACREIEWFDSRSAADEAERVTIRHQKPAYNVIHHAANTVAWQEDVHMKRAPRTKALTPIVWPTPRSNSELTYDPHDLHR